MCGLDTSYHLLDTRFTLTGVILRWYSLENPWYDWAVLTPSLFTLNVTPGRCQQAGPKVSLGSLEGPTRKVEGGTSSEERACPGGGIGAQPIRSNAQGKS